MKNHRPFTTIFRLDAAAFARRDSLSPWLGGVTIGGGLIGGGLPGSGGPIGGALPTTPITQENLKPETRLFFGPLTYVGGSLARIDTDGGYISDGRFHAVYPDFQGNIRAVACGGEIKQVNHYYPYGLPFAEGIKPDAQPYSSACRFAPAKNYGAKELVTDANLNLYDFHARFYDPVVNHFMHPDILSESEISCSPWVYCKGNPINYSDPTGMHWVYNPTSNKIEWIDSAVDRESTPDEYRYVGENNNDILSFFHLSPDPITTTSDQIGFSLAHASGAWFSLIGSKTKFTSYFKASAITDRPKIQPSDINKEGHAFNLLEFTASFSEINKTTNEDAHLTYFPTCRITITSINN